MPSYISRLTEELLALKKGVAPNFNVHLPTVWQSFKNRSDDYKVHNGVYVHLIATAPDWKQLTQAALDASS